MHRCVDIACMQLLIHVLKPLKALHAAGYGHCNIKPSNILQRQKHHDWILSDLGCAAPIGTMPPPTPAPPSPTRSVSHAIVVSLHQCMLPACNESDLVHANVCCRVGDATSEQLWTAAVLSPRGGR
jgi:serine/threonine protein kinase